MVRSRCSKTGPKIVQTLISSMVRLKKSYSFANNKIIKSLTAEHGKGVETRLCTTPADQKESCFIMSRTAFSQTPFRLLTTQHSVIPLLFPRER